MEEFAGAQRVDLEIYQGCDYEDSIQILNEEGNPVAFNNCSFKGQIKRYINDNEALADIQASYNIVTKSVDFQITANENKKLHFLRPSATEVFFYDIIYTTADGKRFPICFGQITVRAGVTE